MGGWHKLCFATYQFIDSVPNPSFIASSVQMETGLFYSFSLPAGQMSGEGAGETLQKESVFHSGSRGSFARLMGSKICFFTD